MPISSLIVSRQSDRSAPPSLNPRPFRSCRFFSLTPYLVTSLLHQSPKPQVTKSPVVHPLSIQQLTECFSPNSFVLITIHFDGGGVPGAYQGVPLAYPPPTLLLYFEEPIRVFAHFCEPAASRMPPFIGSSVDVRRENDIPEQGSGRQELDGNE